VPRESLLRRETLEGMLGGPELVTSLDWAGVRLEPDAGVKLSAVT